jgi:hypothetical protein
MFELVSVASRNTQTEPSTALGPEEPAFVQVVTPTVSRLVYAGTVYRAKWAAAAA